MAATLAILPKREPSEIEMSLVGGSKIAAEVQRATERMNKIEGVKSDINQLERSAAVMADDHVKELTDRILTELKELVVPKMNLTESDLLVEALGAVLIYATAYPATTIELLKLYFDAFICILNVGSMTELVAEQLCLGILSCASSTSTLFLSVHIAQKEAVILKMLREIKADSFSDYSDISGVKKHFVSTLAIVWELM